LALLYPGAPWVQPLFAERFAQDATGQANYAPGARLAFEEAGQLYGEEGAQEWYSQRTDPQRWWLDYIPQYTCIRSKALASAGALRLPPLPLRSDRSGKHREYLDT